MNYIQVTALIIFILMFVLIVTEKIERHVVSLACGGVMLVLVVGIMMKEPGSILDILALKDFVDPSFWYDTGEAAEGIGINWETIVFILGMMIMVEGMGRVGFFRWLCLKIANGVNYNPYRIFITFMCMSFFLAMFIDSITVILFLAAVTLEIAELLKFNPITLIIAEIFCANLGGSATMCGDPPNIIIGTALHYTFFDFLKNLGPMSLIVMIFTICYFFFIFKKEMKNDGYTPIDVESLDMDLLSPAKAIKDKKGFIVNTLIFLLAVVLLVSHASTGLSVATIGVVVAVLTVIAGAKHLPEIMSKVDFATLFFFVGLFIVVSGLEITGILDILAGFIAKMSKGNFMLSVAIIIWISAIASAFMDNIPFAATMVPVIKSLAMTQGFDLHIMAWTLAAGTDIGGCGTPIGASANVVGIATASKKGHFISWKRYCTLAGPMTILSIAMFMGMIFVRYF